MNHAGRGPKDTVGQPQVSVTAYVRVRGRIDAQGRPYAVVRGAWSHRPKKHREGETVVEALVTVPQAALVKSGLSELAFVFLFFLVTAAFLVSVTVACLYQGRWGIAVPLALVSLAFLAGAFACWGDLKVARFRASQPEPPEQELRFRLDPNDQVMLRQSERWEV